VHVTQAAAGDATGARFWAQICLHPAQYVHVAQAATGFQHWCCIRYR